MKTVRQDCKHALVIAYAFPPCGGAGVQRTAKFVRYLPEFGWMPTVLTVDESCYGVKDNSHANDLPEGVEIIRTPHFDPVARFSRSPAAPRERSKNGSHSSSGLSFKKALRAVGKGGWLALDKTLLVPDQAVLWCPRAITAGLRAHRRKPFDLIYATGEPYSDYFTASALSRIAGVPFVIDMRDPWTLSPYRNETRKAARQSIERWQERRVLAACRACIFANRSTDLYSEAFPQWAEKFHYIPNGYDSSDFEGVEPERFDRFTIVHSGTFLPGYRTADTFLLAMRELLSSQPALAERLQVIFVGKIGEERNLIHELKLSDVVKQTGYIPHAKSIAYLKGADLLLLVGGHHRWEETGKVYEYFAAGKPILALVNTEGEAARLLREYTVARIVDRESVPETQDAISEILSGSMISPDADAAVWVARFERKRLTEKLARVFEECI